jgi:hypothetical protein
MKLVGGIVLWVVIATIFFRWYSEEEDQHVPRAMSRDIDSELAKMGMTEQ